MEVPFLTQKELDKLAKDNAPMPSGLPMHAQCYYISSRGLYEQYRDGKISLEVAKKEKEEVLKQYALGEQQWRFFLKLHTVEEKLKALKADPFNTVLEMEVYEILDQILK